MNNWGFDQTRRSVGLMWAKFLTLTVVPLFSWVLFPLWAVGIIISTLGFTFFCSTVSYFQHLSLSSRVSRCRFVINLKWLLPIFHTSYIKWRKYTNKCLSKYRNCWFTGQGAVSTGGKYRVSSDGEEEIKDIDNRVGVSENGPFLYWRKEPWVQSDERDCRNLT